MVGYEILHQGVKDSPPIISSIRNHNGTKVEKNDDVLTWSGDVTFPFIKHKKKEKKKRKKKKEKKMKHTSKTTTHRVSVFLKLLIMSISPLNY
jgi:hypothetical protein